MVSQGVTVAFAKAQSYKVIGDSCESRPSRLQSLSCSMSNQSLGFSEPQVPLLSDRTADLSSKKCGFSEVLTKAGGPGDRGWHKAPVGETLARERLGPTGGEPHAEVRAWQFERQPHPTARPLASAGATPGAESSGVTLI